jgi:hypothetical protein
VNLELPFDEPEPSELDEVLARIDRELDVLFLEAVSGALERRRAEPPASDPAAAVA